MIEAEKIDKNSDTYGTKLIQQFPISIEVEIEIVSYNTIYFFMLSFMKGFHVLGLHIFVYSASKFQLFIFAINYEHVLHNHTCVLHYISVCFCTISMPNILSSLFSFILSLVHGKPILH